MKHDTLVQPLSVSFLVLLSNFIAFFLSKLLSKLVSTFSVNILQEKIYKPKDLKEL